jgi:hypothetical protein
MTDIYEDLATARAILSDIRYSIKLTKSSCPECGNERWDDWSKYQVRNNLDGALSRVEKAMEVLNGKQS